MVKRTRRQVAAILLGVLLFLGTGGPALAQLPAPPVATGLDALASMVPLNTQVFLALDLRSRVRLLQVMDALDKMKADHPEIAQRLDETEAALGITLRSVASCATPALVVAVFPRAGSRSVVPLNLEARPFEVVAGLPVTDDAAAKDVIKRLVDHSGITLEARPIAGGKVLAWFSGQGEGELGYCVVNHVVLVGTGQQALEASLACQAHQAPSLTELPFFRDVRQKLVNTEGVLAFAGLQDMLDGLPPIQPTSKIDAETLKPLAAIKYLAFGMSVVQDRLDTEMFLKLDRGSDSALIQALLTPRPTDLDLAKFFPTRWGNFNSVDLVWVASVVMAGARLVPAWRDQISVQAISDALHQNLGLNLATDILPAFEGEVATTSNALEILPNYFTHAAGGRPSPTILVAFKLTDADVAQQTVTRLLSHLALKPFPARKLPTATIQKVRIAGDIVRFAIVRTPVPMLLVSNGPWSEKFIEDAIATGTTQAEPAVASLTELQSLLDARQGAVVSSDYMNLKSLTKVWLAFLRARLSQMPEEGQAAGQLAVQTADKLAPPEGVSILQVEPDGLRYSSRGTPTALIGFTAGLIAGMVYAHRALP